MERLVLPLLTPSAPEVLAPLAARADLAALSGVTMTPAALIENLTADRFDVPTREMATTVAEGYAAVVRDGAWFSPVRAGLDAFVDRVLDPVSGEVRLRVVDGRIEVDA